MTLEPKKRFRDSAFRKPWHELTEQEWFLRGLESAMLEMQRVMPQALDLGGAAANEFRMKGAQQFVSILLNLTESVPEPRPIFQQNLDHTV